jgi:chitinase
MRAAGCSLGVLALVACGDDAGSQAAPPFEPPWAFSGPDAAVRPPGDASLVASDGAPADGPAGGDAPPPGDAGRLAHALAVYWGQDVWGGDNPNSQSNWEKPLDKTCANNPDYDIVVLSGVVRFTHTGNASGLPSENFANHCSAPYDANDPTYFSCPGIAQGITACQAMGKRVLLALGGGTPGYGFTSDADAQTFAQTVWTAFLGGGGSMRTFGAAVLDGVVLDIQSGASIGYAAFATKLRALAGPKTVIAGAPGCLYPDPRLGPGSGTALGSAASAFDALFVRFYDDASCQYSSSAPAPFDQSFGRWAALGPLVFVGLPASSVEVTSGYVSRATLPSLVSVIKTNRVFGGVALYEASYDQNSVNASGQTYGATVAGLIH